MERERVGGPGDVAADSSRVDWIVGTYLVVAIVWILVSSPVAVWIDRHTAVPLGMVETAKGLVFVAVTAIVLRGVLGRWAARLVAAAWREREAADRLRRAESLRSVFLNGVSHELRTPLTSIGGYAATIQRHGGVLAPDQLAELADRLVVNTNRLERLVLDLLDTDALLRGVESLHPRYVDVGPLVRRVAAQTDPRGRTIDLDGVPVMAEVDVAKFERAVKLLLDNVVRHTPPDTAVNVRWRSHGTDLVLIVEDDGPGLAPELSGRAFEPFVQGGVATSSPRPGLGIGLTLVEQYVRLHHGRVAATNAPHGGARIEVTVPILQHLPAPASEPGVPGP